MAPREQRELGSAQIWHILALLIVAPASTALAFYLVLAQAGREDLIFGGAAEVPADVIDAGPEAGAGVDAEVAHPPPAAEPFDPTVFGELTVRPAPRITMGDPYYFRCWNEGEEEPLSEENCDVMRPLERTVASEMGTLVACFERLDRPTATGELSLAVDVDFAGAEDSDEAMVRFWSGGSTDLEGAEEIVACMRGRLERLSVRGISHQRERYTIFFPLDFAERRGEGKPVALVLDRVRLRTEPVDGDIIARLNQGEPLIVHELRDEWARITTVDGREGWVFDDAITVTAP